MHRDSEAPREPVDETSDHADRVSSYLDVSHRVGNKLLDVMDGLCTRHSIDYFITSGTLLGAVRHGGWIAWDDDVDVVMFREDFERLRVVAAEELPPDVLFSDGLSNAEHITSIPRLLYLSSRRRPSGRTRTRRPIETRHIAMDIFVLDLAPRGRRARALWTRTAYLLERAAVARMTSMRDVLVEPNLPAVRKAAELVAVAVSRLLSRHQWHHIRDRLIRFREGTSGRGVYMAANYSTPHGRTCTFERDWYFPPTTATFESRDLPAPRDPSAVLAELFGPTFLTPPPSSERHPIHIRNGLEVSLDGSTWDIAPD